MNKPAISINVNPVRDGVNPMAAHARPPTLPPTSSCSAADDELKRVKKLVQIRNDELYKLQVTVLKLTWEEDKDDSEYQVLTARCQAKEAEVNALCDQLKTAREEMVATRVAVLEQYAESPVRELQATITTRGEREQSKASEAHSFPDSACSDSSDSSDSADSDSDLEYEEVEELSVGDSVRVCHDDDGFVRGDVATITEVDLTIPYPYRVKSTARSGADGYFKACDLQLVRRRSAPLSQHVVQPASSERSRTPSPYSNKQLSSPYEKHVTPCHDIDLEKGLCRSRSNSPSLSDTLYSAIFAPRSQTDADTAEQCKHIALTLNPLSVC